MCVDFGVGVIKDLKISLLYLYIYFIGKYYKLLWMFSYDVNFKIIELIYVLFVDGVEEMKIEF